MKKMLAICAFFMASCAVHIPQEALKLTPEGLEMRPVQTRTFETQNQNALLVPAISILQDLSFDIDFTEKELGLVVGSKTANATDYGEIAGRVLMTALLGTDLQWDTEQKVKVSVFVVPIGDKKSKFRIAFQRIVWNNHGNMTKVETIKDPQIYQDFFSKLSKAVFLDAHKL